MKNAFSKIKKVKIIKPIILIITIYVFTGCPDPPPQAVDCDSGYHWNEDRDKCIMDTTSHNFIWRVDTIGNKYISVFNDIAIVNENNIWVVGEIDTDSGSYNCAKWDGIEWSMTKLGANFGSFTLSPPLNSIYYFSANDIWVLGSYPIHWDGEEWTLYHLTDMGIIPGGLSGKIWGSSPNNIFFIGIEGRIVHYNGLIFEKMETGTNLNLLEIDGSDDGANVFVTGNNYLGEFSGQSIVLELVDGEWNTLFESDSYSGNPNEGNYGWFTSMDLIGDTVYIACGGTDLLKYNYVTKVIDFIPKYSSPINGRLIKHLKGNSASDLVLISADREIIHYNGASFYIDNFIPNTFGDGSGRFRSFEARYENGIICIVGETQIGLHGIIVTGIHY